HRTHDFSVPDSVTTVPVPESVTTSRISGRISTASASAAPPPRHSERARRSRHEREPVLMRDGTPARPGATNETGTTARGGSAHQKEGDANDATANPKLTFHLDHSAGADGHLKRGGGREAAAAAARVGPHRDHRCAARQPDELCGPPSSSSLVAVSARAAR